MSENIAVHSNKHFEYLLEKTHVDEIDRDESQMSSHSDTKSQKFDMLTIGEGRSADVERHYDEDMNSNVKFIDKEENSEFEATAVEDDYVDYDREGERDRLAELERHYKKLEEDYSNLERSNLIDSLDTPHRDESLKIGEKIVDVDEGGNVVPLYPDGRKRGESIPMKVTPTSVEHLPKESERKVSNLKPAFRYKEPMPKFIAKNKTVVGRKSQGSYCQKYLTERKEEEKIRKILKKEDLKIDINKTDIRQTENCDTKKQKDDYFTQHPENISENFLDHKRIDFMPRDMAVGEKSHVTMQQPLRDVKYLRENVEITRLENMIKQEEHSLNNHVLAVPTTQIMDVYDTEPHSGTDYMLNKPYQQFPHQSRNLQIETLEPSMRQSIGSISQHLRKDEQGKASSYAERHYLSLDKHNSPPSEILSSYAAQHLGKKKEASYKKYSLKDYKALNNDIKLQRSLGPDKASKEYLEKKARSDKLKDYATAVAALNRQKMVVKKARSAPAPTVRDRLLESKRNAALEYAKNVKVANLSGKGPKNHDRQRPSSDRRGKLSALEIMKQRHESERLAVEEMRQNLANIIKEVKSST